MNKWDVRFLRLAYVVSTWSKDPSTKVGAVITVGKNYIVSTGFNGYPPHIKDTLDDPREVKYEKTIHAEDNALRFAHRPGDSIYVTHMPCEFCMEKIGKAGIKRVVHMSAPEYDTRPDWADRLEASKSIAARYEISLTRVDRSRVLRYYNLRTTMRKICYFLQRIYTSITKT